MEVLQDPIALIRTGDEVIPSFAPLRRVYDNKLRKAAPNNMQISVIQPTGRQENIGSLKLLVDNLPLFGSNSVAELVQLVMSGAPASLIADKAIDMVDATLNYSSAELAENEILGRETII